MQDTRSNSSSVFLSVINVEVAKIATSFMTFLSTYLHSNLFACKYSIQHGSGPWSCPYPFLLPQWH